MLPVEATEPEGRNIRISPKRIPLTSSNHVESRKGQGAVQFEIPGGISMAYSITKLLCASAHRAKTIPELYNCTLNQRTFNLQEHPAVTNLSNMLKKPHSSIRSDSLCCQVVALFL